MSKCLFNECHNDVEPGTAKCVFHRNRSQCIAPNCRNQAYARGHCVRHGARKYCLMEGCVHYRRAGGYCARHTTALRNAQRLAPIQPAVISVFKSNEEPLNFYPEARTPTNSSWLDSIDWGLVHELTRNDNVFNDSSAGEICQKAANIDYICSGRESTILSLFDFN